MGTSEAVRSDAAVSARARRALTVGLCTAVTAIAFEVISVATAMPAAARELDGLDLYAWAFSLFLIGQLFATVAAGRLCDRVGPARPMAGGMAAVLRRARGRGHRSHDGPADRRPAAPGARGRAPSRSPCTS